MKGRAADQQGDVCSLPPEAPGSGIRCMAYIPSWTFNSTSGQCERYIYGGCGKTANLFKTQEACNAVCGLATRNLNITFLNFLINHFITCIR